MFAEYDDDRSPILDLVTGYHVSLKHIDRDAERGRYVCAVCYKIRKDAKKSAVYLKGGTPKTCLHASHFPKNGCSAGQTAIHVMVAECIAAVTGGILECLYPDDRHRADVRSGSIYWEVVYTGSMSEPKRQSLNPMVTEGQIKIKIVNINKIPREMMVDLLDIRDQHDDWQHRWFDMINVEPFAKEYRPRGQVLDRKASVIQPIGDNKVGHFGAQCCTGCEFAYTEGSNDLFHCTQADRYYKTKMVVTNGSRCEFNLGIKPTLPSVNHDE